MLKRKERYHVAVAGATGVVGQEMIEILEERNFPIEALHPFASERSAGKSLSFCGEEVMIENLGTADFSVRFLFPSKRARARKGALGVFLGAAGHGCFGG